MDKKILSQPLYKRRSLVACMEYSFKILRSNWLGIIKAAWIPLIIFAIGEALVIVSGSSLNPNPVWSIIGFLVTLVGYLTFFGLFYHWMENYKKNSEFIPLDFRHNIKASLRQLFRFLVVHIPAGILITILLYISIYSFLSLVIPLPFSIPLWVGIVALVVLIYLCIPLTVFCIDFLIGKQPYFSSFIKGMILGTRHWGAFFALGFMVMVLYGLFSILVSLPLEVSFIIEMMNRNSMAEGNSYALPAFFPIAKFILSCIVAFVIELASLYPLLSLILLYTSYEVQSKERATYENQQKEADNLKKV